VGNSVTVQVVPLGGDGSSRPRNLSIGLIGSNATAPAPQFSFNPEAPILQEPVAFDASATTDEGVTCGDACTYACDFGGEATAAGRVVTYRFLAVRTYAVRLTVTDPGGATASATQNVTVSTGDEPAAQFTFSPASPGQFETVNFTAATSRAGTGRSIASYEWRFGDGATATGINATHAYNVVGVYNVTLTVTDTAGLKHTVTNPVTVVNGVTASFTISPSPSSTSRQTIYDAEGSQGSNSGFGTRNPISQYIWNFGETTDIETTSNRLIGYTYSRAGIYTVTLTVVDTANRRATTTRNITVN
jgi:PKD repeat protein